MTRIAVLAEGVRSHLFMVLEESKKLQNFDKQPLGFVFFDIVPTGVFCAKMGGG